MKRALFSALMLSLLFPLLFPLLFSLGRPLDGCRGWQLGIVSATDYVNVNVSEAKQVIDSDPRLVVLDVRTLEEYESGHIQNATLIPITELANRLGELNKGKYVLVYCRTGARSATASQMLVDSGFSKVYNMLGGITAWRNAGYWIEMVHYGDLVINGTQTFLIENCTYIQTGNVHVGNYGKLIIRDSAFVFNQTYWAQNEFVVDDSGSLVTEDAQLTSDRGLELHIHENASVSIKDITALNWWWFPFDWSSIDVINSTIDRLWPSDSSRAFVCNSSINYVALTFNEPDYVTLADLRPKYYPSWQLRVGSSSILEIENTTVKKWDVFVLGSSVVTIADSKIDVHLGIHDYGQNTSSVQISGLGPGLYRLWSLHDNQSIQNLRYDLTLENTTVDFWQISVWGKSKANITDTDAHVHAFDHGKVDVENSIVRHLHIRDEAEVVLGNSIVTELLSVRHFHGKIILSNTTVDIGEYNIAHSSFYVGGEWRFVGDSQRVEATWDSSNVTRNFKVIVGNSFPVANATLTLLNQDNVFLWNGTTNNLGQADFNLTFTDSNYTDVLCLKARSPGLYSAVTTAFLSSTPLTLSLTMLGDVNGDRRINILDIATLARAYCTHPGDFRWDPRLDLDDDGHIGIIDITRAAKDYGKTV